MLAIISKNEPIIGHDYAKALIPIIDAAKHSIEIMMFEWRWYKTDPTCDMSLINQAIVRAVRRNVKVRALINYRDNLELLNMLGIQARAWNDNKLMHAKAVIVDKKTAVMGSHNFSMNAMGYNVELSTIHDDAELVGKLSKYFDSLWQLSS